MNNEEKQNMAKVLHNSDRQVVITELEKDFLLSDPQVLDRIIARLLNDFKYL